MGRATPAPSRHFGPDERGEAGTADIGDRVITAQAWHAGLAGGLPVTATLRRFSGGHPTIEQPPLRENVLALHLGGAKRVTRRRCGRTESHDVSAGSVTVMPSLEPNHWSTEGPIDFAHLVLSPGLLRQTAAEEFDRDPRDLELLDRVGSHHAVIESCLMALLADLDRPSPGRLYRDSLMAVIAFSLVHDCSTLSASTRVASPGAGSRGGLASWQTRRVVDYMQAHLAEDIGIDTDLRGLTGLGRAQFYRAFRKTTGFSPHAYLNDLRVNDARRLLQNTGMPVGDVAEAVGLSRTHLLRLYQRRFGIAPATDRRRTG